MGDATHETESGKLLSETNLEVQLSPTGGMANESSMTTVQKAARGQAMTARRLATSMFLENAN
jgi:hypothetical protein